MILFFSYQTWAWGSRGHSLICESAIHLVKNPALKKHLITKAQAITYLCNLPDTYWRNIKGTESGNATHYFEPDLIALSIEHAPLSFSELVKIAQGKTNLNTNQPVFSVPSELGSSWWRADQFFRISAEAGKLSGKESINDKGESSTYKMWVMMGLLGHFVGDNAQPFHNTRDYDGWIENHGGIHKYYETDLVNELPLDILEQITKRSVRAKLDLQFDKYKTILELMKQLSMLSHKDIKILYTLDPIIKPSKLVKEKGMELKTPAERKDTAESVAKFKPILLTHLSRGAVLLAHTWDQIYENAGKPSFQKENPFLFPHQYEFIAPDYLQ